jgi:glycosyltransferase involved in cell wall biosynthesis
MKVLFVGESWLGSCARSMKEALARHSEILLDEVNEDLIFAKFSKRWVRAFNRLLRKEYRKELLAQIMCRARIFQPDVIVFYKCAPMTIEDLSQLREFECLLVCIYPDYSPHAYGEAHRLAVGAYDLVISTKPFHPANWNTVYGYTNDCHFVPQGYDPMLHLAREPASNPRFDVGIVATYRRGYGELVNGLLTQLAGNNVTFGIGGRGWRDFAIADNVVVAGELCGRSYIEWLRSAKICVAPVTGSIRVSDGTEHPGDVDTTRTYELAAAQCFFIHKRTDYVRQLYDEQCQVPMYGCGEELAEKIRYFLSKPEERLRMAAAAHKRAVPDYSLDRRAEEIVVLLRTYSQDGRTLYDRSSKVARELRG